MSSKKHKYPSTRKPAKKVVCKICKKLFAARGIVNHLKLTHLLKDNEVVIYLNQIAQSQQTDPARGTSHKTFGAASKVDKIKYPEYLPKNEETRVPKTENKPYLPSFDDLIRKYDLTDKNGDLRGFSLTKREADTYWVLRGRGMSDEDALHIALK